MRIVFLLALAACAKAPSETGLKHAVIHTSMGDIAVKLFAQKTPAAVENFIALADGAKEWRDPRSGKKVKGVSLYKGVLFHRVIPGFMIQAGDPLGDGMGDVGFSFKDEFDKTLRYDKPGKLGMANFGPNTNASQFFITVAAAPQLNGLHTLFGEVEAGMDVVDAIVSVPRDMDPGSHTPDKPLKPVTILGIEVKGR